MRIARIKMMIIILLEYKENNWNRDYSFTGAILVFVYVFQKYIAKSRIIH